MKKLRSWQTWLVVASGCALACGPEEDEDYEPCTTRYVDEDGDGIGRYGPVGCGSPQEDPEWAISLGGDCDDHDPEVGRSLPYYRDADGDGFSVGPEEYLCYETAPEGYTDRPPSFGGTDCDDADPERHYGVNFYHDGDGDGFGVPGAAHTYACYGDTVEGMAPNADDCNDANPELNRVLYRDQDGDGYGVEADAACANSEDSDYALRIGDCDDGDPDTYPRSQFEQPLDGVDTDCDGFDFPIALCSEGPLLDPAELTPAADCTNAVDLVIVAADQCATCTNGVLRLIVGNRGSLPAQAEIWMRHAWEEGGDRGDPWVVEIGDPIPPGSASDELSLDFPFPAVDVELVEAGGMDDCVPDNGQGFFAVGFVDCI